MLFADPPAISAPSDTKDQAELIEVVGSRADQTQKIDRRTYRVKDNPNSAQADSFRLLRGLPAVTITPDDQINLLGSGNVTIQVDGRTVSDPDTIAYLRTLHGSDIERIEIITNPSAQYSAEGTGGIINFVLRKKQGSGVSGNASSEISTIGGGYVDGTVKSKHGRWTYELHAGGRAGATRRSSYDKLRSIEDVPGGSATINTERGGGPSHGREGEASVKISYDLNQRTSLAAKLLGGAAYDGSSNDAEFIGLTPDFASFDERQRSSTALSFVISELTFDHKGKTDGETLNASLRLFALPTQHEVNRNSFSDSGALFTDKQKQFLMADSQVDWQHPLGKGEILSIGALWRYSRMSERYRFDSTSEALGPAASDQFDAVEDTLAAYATFQQPLGTWTVMPGLRVERNSRHLTSPGEPDVDITRAYLFPTLHVEHPIGKSLDLTISYSKRIDRVQLNDLRPYPLVQDIVTIKQANPRLKDQTVDAYEASLKYHRKKLDAGVTVYDRETAHLISQSYQSVDGVSLVTIINSGKSRDRGAEFDVSTPLVRHVKLMGSVNLFDSRVPVGGRMDGTSESMFRYSTNGTLEWDAADRGKIPGDVAQLQWIYNGPYRQFELHYLEWNQVNLAYTHNFSRTVSATGTMTYNSINRHDLLAPLVQEYYRDRRPVEFKLKLLKTFGNNH